MNPRPLAPSNPARWWESLRHFGLLLGPGQVANLDSLRPEPLHRYRIDQLRREMNRREAGQSTPSEFAAWVLENLCGFADRESGTWKRGKDVPPSFTRNLVSGEAMKPRHVWTSTTGGVLPVFIDPNKRLGIGRSRKVVSDTVQWLRLARLPFGLVTNGGQWRLLFVGLDYEAACEWDVEKWFEEGVSGPQLDALRLLIAPKNFAPPAEGAPPPLAALVLESRQGQTDLSAELGERVREAVETLVQAHGPVLSSAAHGASGAEIYRAAVRVAMRMVFILFAESRGMLPRDNPVYHANYGLQGLQELLQKVAIRGHGRLAHQHAAWPRLLGLFRLIHDGSHHEALPLPAYGGDLFAPGAPDAPDAAARILHLFETACFDPRHQLMPDSTVHRMIELLTRTRVRIRQGRSSIMTTMPVDFSDLSSEYIGILYEGLLDYELRPAPEDDSIVFLAVGDEPALPLKRLEAMSEKEIKDLLENLKEKKKAADAESENEEADEEPGEDAVLSAEEESDEATSLEEAPMEVAAEGAAAEDEFTAAAETSAADAARARALAWTQKACVAAGLVAKPRGRMTPEKEMAFQREIEARGRQMVKRVILPGEWYLVRWGGTRKGAGTFYTRPQLAVPTVHRTLFPLAYERLPGAEGSRVQEGETGTLDPLNPGTLSRTPEPLDPRPLFTPRTPEEILALKVCDPACGSGSFPVAALRFLTDTLYASLFAHGRISAEGRSFLLDPSNPRTLEPLPYRPDDENFEPVLKARLRRHVVERCIYGVDLDPVAIELCRLALWIETMDRDLPFGFLDHKVKCGNSLVGCWLDRFRHYPVLAWSREGGDKAHANGVHFEKEERTRAIKAFKSGTVKNDLAGYLDAPRLFRKDDLKEDEAAYEAATVVLDAIHEIPLTEGEERARVYRDQFTGNEAFRVIREALDRWCAVWFWPADALEAAPLPSTFHKPSEATEAIVRRLAAEKRFFHWELEFPDAFNSARRGFDAVVGNPPWDIAKPNSKEFFSNIDPLYRSYGKQEAIRKQAEYFADEAAERAWLDYNADFKAQSNFVKFAADPWGDPTTASTSGERFSIARGKANEGLHETWRTLRSASRGYADPNHPFRHQGSADINLYKLFLEEAHALLKEGGRLGFIVPSGLYSDHGSGALRELFLDHCRWEWIFGFENREGIFPDVDGRFKFNPVIIEKGGSTEAIQTAFMRRKLEDWENGEAFATPYTRERVTRFSPKSKAILEIQSSRDLEILEKIYANSVLLGDDGPDGWGIKYATEFHMTNDSKLFPPRPQWEAKGYQPDEYSRWLKGQWRPIAKLWEKLKTKPLPEGERRVAQPPYDTLPIPRADIPAGIILSRDASQWIAEDEIEDTALPLYQGVMVGAYDPSKKKWLSGTGLNAKWEEIEWIDKQILPQFLMSISTLAKSGKAHITCKVGFRDIARTTDQRTMIACPIPRLPCGNKVPTLRSESIQAPLLQGILNSYSFDWSHRIRQGSTSINFHVIEEAPLIKFSGALLHGANAICMVVAAATRLFAPEWLASKSIMRSSVGWKGQWAITSHERLRMRVIADAIFMTMFNLDESCAKIILEETDIPAEDLSNSQSRSLNPKGFWRIDKEKDPELRHTVLTLVAFHDLEEKIAAAGGDRDKGIEAFCNQNNGEGWMLPETLRLADYNLGHDDRAQHPQPVASRLGPRFLDWQLAQTPEESWRECELHARNLRVTKKDPSIQDNQVGPIEPNDSIKAIPNAVQAGLFD